MKQIQKDACQTQKESKLNFKKLYEIKSLFGLEYITVYTTETRIAKTSAWSMQGSEIAV